MSAKAGSFNISTAAATTTVAVTGVGFTPTAILFWWSGRTTGTDGAGGAPAQVGFGVVKSATERWSLASHISDGTDTTTTAGRRQSAAACICEVTAGGVAGGAADLQSFDADGFTVIIDAQFTTDFRVSYLALGGDHSSVAVGSFDSAVGALSETGLGFQPECIIFGTAAFGTEAAGTAGNAYLSVGAATGPSNEWTCGVFSSDGDPATNTGRTLSYAFGNECISSGFTNLRVELTSLDADGFTVNVLEGTTAAFWIALAGGQYFASDFLSRTDTTQTGITGVGFTPTALLTASCMAAENTQNVATNNAALCIGAANSATSRTVQGVTEDDGSDPTECFTAIEHDEMYVRGDLADAVVGLMDLVSFDADGFTFVMDDADPTAAFIGFLAFGDDDAAAATESDAGLRTGSGFITFPLKRIVRRYAG